MKNSNLSFSVILPFYNEEKFLSKTLDSWVAQERLPDELILIDNNSDDLSSQMADSFVKQEKNIRTICIMEKKPGKISSLAAGIRQSKGDIIVLSDADTYYPPHYLKMVEEIFLSSKSSVSAVMALPQYSLPITWQSNIRRRFYALFHKIWNKHCFTGGYAQNFKRKALDTAGGFSTTCWPYVLLDHEIMYRIHKKGQSRYHHRLWCHPSPRRKNRRSVRWNGIERFLYILCPHFFQGWFFYSFLASRFKKRGMYQLRLREKPWDLDSVEQANSEQKERGIG